VAVWAGTIFVLSSIPGSAYPQTTIRHADKIVHLFLYSTLGALVARALLMALARTEAPATTEAAARWRHRLRSVIGATTILVTFYGITDELHQVFVPGRSADWHDAAADAIGGVLGAVIGLLLWGRRD
jgi:VanZ family protein